MPIGIHNSYPSIQYLAMVPNDDGGNYDDVNVVVDIHLDDDNDNNDCDVVDDDDDDDNDCDIDDNDDDTHWTGDANVRPGVSTSL